MQRNLSRLAGVVQTLLAAEPRIIIECGARDCRETLDFTALYPHAQIYAIECNPDMLPLCRSAVTGQPNIELVEAAVAECSGRTRFYPIDSQASGTSYNPGASSLLVASGKYTLEHYQQREIEVDAITLESFCAAHSLPGIDVLWMDIQGGELGALRGLGSRIADVKLIHLEVEFQEIYAQQPLFPDILRFLHSRQFSFLGFTVYARHSADAVFANRRHFSTPRLTRALFTHPILTKKRLTYARHRLKRRLLGRPL